MAFLIGGQLSKSSEKNENVIIFVIGGLVELGCTGRMPMQAFAWQDLPWERRRDGVRENSSVMGNAGKLATFIVHVQYCQNATWQGTIVWADEKQTSNFRSALEMLKLMDSAVEQSNESRDRFGEDERQQGDDRKPDDEAQGRMASDGKK